jgi:hypothetical protein
MKHKVEFVGRENRLAMTSLGAQILYIKEIEVMEISVWKRR